MIGEHGEAAFLKTLTLLYVEDDPSTREEVAEFLRRRAGTVLVAADGAQGLAAFRASPAQIVVTDIRMPRLDGLAMARELRLLEPQLPVIVTTAFEQPDYLASAIELGIDQYVVKPVQGERLAFALLTCAHRLLADAQLRQQRRLEAEALRTRQQLALGRLLGELARDYQTLLQDILGTVELARTRLAPASEADRILGRCRPHLDQAFALGSRLFRLADPDEPKPLTGSLDQLIRDTVLETLAGSPVQAGFQFEAQAAVNHSAEGLAQVFRSLAQNAREAMPGGGALQVSTESCRGTARPAGDPQERFLRISFRDTGPGIAPGDLAQVFEPCFSTRAPDGRGPAGLGLALCAAIVRAHGGSISAHSKPGAGTTIRILLPLALGWAGPGGPWGVNPVRPAP